jgi:hypothetical protein
VACQLVPAAAGRVEVRTSPSPAIATHSDAVGHEIAVNVLDTVGPLTTLRR